ncbi:MAG: ATP synthase F1 subunit gamma [Clostridia bacterium]|nr:ATP synthase F1 subunit gamma [Clostridia bacterium]
MAADIKSLRTRIKSVTSTLHLTKAMGLVASSKIRRATEAMNKGRQYEKAVRDAVTLLTSSPECEKSPYMQKREGKKTRIVVIAGDRGLAGGYNANILRLAKQYPDAEFIGVGKRACDRFGTKLYRAEGFSYSDAMEISQKLCEDFKNGEYDRLAFIGTKYISMMTQEAEIKWILPLERTDSSSKAGIIFEPDELTILNNAVLEYITGILVATVRESFTSEVAARRCAMDSAGKNATEMIDSLSLQYNRARQGAITQEITEIVAGSGQ